MRGNMYFRRHIDPEKIEHDIEVENSKACTMAAVEDEEMLEDDFYSRM